MTGNNTEVVGLTGIDALEAEMRDRLAAKNAEIEKEREKWSRLAKERNAFAARLSTLNYLTSNAFITCEAGGGEAPRVVVKFRSLADAQAFHTALVTND